MKKAKSPARGSRSTAGRTLTRGKGSSVGRWKYPDKRGTRHKKRSSGRDA